MSYRYDDNIKGDFVIVHTPANVGVAGGPDEATAQADADKRNAKAQELGLSCKYVVRPRSEGHGVTKAEYEAAQAAKK